MNGIELAKGYYETYGKPMLEERFSHLLPFLAVGFVGNGSEHYGFDDEVSRDHDFEPGFCIFLPDESVIDRRCAFLLERAYAKLPKEFGGVTRQMLSPVGGNRNGVIRTAEFYESLIGSPDGNLSVNNWLHLEDCTLADATNGEIFVDNYGEFSEIRRRVLEMPDDIRKKRLAANLLRMAQAGQYNFVRCLKHGEPEAAQLACGEFVNAALKVIFLLQNRYLPYYKWSFRALRGAECGAALVEPLASLLRGDNTDAQTASEKYDTIEEICSQIIGYLQARNLTQAICGDLEKHAYSVNDAIADGTVRNLHILSAC